MTKVSDIMVENRQHPRFRLRMPVLCEGPAVHDYRALGVTQNVSQSGLLIEVPQLVALGTATNLRLLTGDRIARAEALVVWTAEPPLNLMGVRFTVMTG
ncbi:MAG: PilZ domain-containing protein, partial [Candidatus Methylomirabilales bacterium]